MKGRNPKRRLLLIGVVLLTLLVVGIVVSGRILNRTATTMSERIITQVGEYHYRLLHLEFRKAEELFAIATRHLRAHPSSPDTELQVLANTLLETDTKISCIWFSHDNGVTMHDFVRQGRAQSISINQTQNLRQEVLQRLQQDSLYSHLVGQGTQLTWSLALRFIGSDGRQHICGLDLSMPELHAYIANQTAASRSYACIIAPNGVIAYHPDSLMIGRRVTNLTSLERLREVRTSGHRQVIYVLSDYLGLSEDRIYYPMQIGQQTWVAMIGIPHLAIEQEMENFHFYTILIAVLSVALFAALLILAQRRWRREYELRRKLEEESAQLHLQRVLDQIDPHFLFNSLNSLYSLIRSNPEQAREFTLTLARVYRHVLEHRHEILATVANELEVTQQYYALQKIRFGECITLSITVAPALHDRLIPAMSLQTLVENAVKHNRITTTNPLRIRIYTQAEQLVIENNYTPRKESNAESLGVGMESIRSVYSFYTDKNILIESSSETFRCRMPLLPAKK